MLWIKKEHYFAGWLLQIPDITPSDFFLWGFVKNVCVITYHYQQMLKSLESE